MKLSERLRPTKRHIVSLFFVAVVALLFFLYLPGLSIEEIREFIISFGPLAPIIFILICMGKPVLIFVPTLGLTVIAGTVFGPFYGTLYVALGGAGSTAVAFFITRVWGRKPLERLISTRETLVRLDDRMEARGFNTILIMRLFNIPWDLVSYSAGLSKMRFKDFYLASLVMLLPISFIYTYFGSTVTSPGSPGFIISLSVIIALVTIPYLIRRSRVKNENS
jgi:uncharacterized membrane protein YdjX (TVP38/TMEM64 family)